jgi:hypothetical protein
LKREFQLEETVNDRVILNGSKAMGDTLFNTLIERGHNREILI